MGLNLPKPSAKLPQTGMVVFWRIKMETTGCFSRDRLWTSLPPGTATDKHAKETSGRGVNPG